MQRNPRVGSGYDWPRLKDRIKKEIASGSRIGMEMARQEQLLGPRMDQLMAALKGYTFDGDSYDLSYDAALLTPAEAEFQFERPMDRITVLVIISEGPLIRSVYYQETEADWKVEEDFSNMLKESFGPSAWYDFADNVTMHVYNENPAERRSIIPPIRTYGSVRRRAARRAVQKRHTIKRGRR